MHHFLFSPTVLSAGCCLCVTKFDVEELGESLMAVLPAARRAHFRGRGRWTVSYPEILFLDIAGGLHSCILFLVVWRHWLLYFLRADRHGIIFGPQGGAVALAFAKATECAGSRVGRPPAAVMRVSMDEGARLPLECELPPPNVMCIGRRGVDEDNRLERWGRGVDG